MKKIWIIIGSVILLILLLAGAWWYLLMNGRPESLSGIPNPFGSFGGSNEFTPPQNTEDPVENSDVQQTLRRISNTPVAGSVITEQSGNPIIRYVERGTGHIYEVNLNTNTTTRISNTTIPRTTEAIWSPQGNRVAIIVEQNVNQRQVFINTIERNDIGEYSLAGVEIPGAVTNIEFSKIGDIVYYTIRTSNGSTGYRHDLKTSARTELFTSILRDIAVSWEPEILVYTTPSAQAFGYGYRGTTFDRILGGKIGLMLIPTKESYITSFLENETLSSYVSTSTILAISAFPEKCATDLINATTLWCGAPVNLVSGQYPDIWYQGVASFDDSIWKVDVTDGSATLLSVPSEDVGEVIDVIDMQINASSTMLVFTNKRDGLLWLQELPQNILPPAQPEEDPEQTEAGE